jgi:Zn-dependent protease
MAWDDRSYSSSDNYRSWGSGLLAVLNGSVPLYQAFGIAVRAHVTLLILIGGELFLDWKSDFPLRERALSMGLLFGIVLLHEYGHCVMARWTGGSADRILLWPLGGLAYTDAPHRPLARFLTSAAGPMVNVAICLFAALAVYALSPIPASSGGGRVIVSLNPFDLWPPTILSATAHFFYWIFELSYLLLLFNLLPIYPLDGGQMVQALIWPYTGYVRSMNFATMTGMVGAAILFVSGFIVPGGNLFLMMLAICGFMTCYNMHNEMKETADESMYGDQFDYGMTLHSPPPPPRKRLSRRAVRRTRKIARQEKAELDRIDRILSKVSSLGMQGLTWSERRALRKATDRQRKRDEELSELGMD